jgi:hypothetical protein
MPGPEDAAVAHVLDNAALALDVVDRDASP